jgi:hypothetical protein
MSSEKNRREEQVRVECPRVHQRECLDVSLMDALLEYHGLPVLLGWRSWAV